MVVAASIRENAALPSMSPDPAVEIGARPHCSSRIVDQQTIAIRCPSLDAVIAGTAEENCSEICGVQAG